MKTTSLIAILAFVLTACGSNKAEENASADTLVTVKDYAPTASVAQPSKPTTSYSYTVINKEVSTMPISVNQSVNKIRYTVEIPYEYSQSALDEIADVIKSQEPIEYVFVEFFMDGQPRTGSNYGISKRTPSETCTEINYIAPPTEPEKPIKKPYDGCKVYGAWSMTGATVVAYQKGGKCYMVNYYGGSNFGDPERYIKTTYGGHTAFKNAEDPADMYVINSYGDLDGYYDGDLATTFPQTIY